MSRHAFDTLTNAGGRNRIDIKTLLASFFGTKIKTISYQKISCYKKLFNFHSSVLYGKILKLNSNEKQ